MTSDAGTDRPVGLRAALRRLATDRPLDLLTLLGALAAAGVLFLMVRPVSVGPVGFDSAASVLHFQRIVSGQRLEAFVTTTPKPLLTLLYGVIHAVIPDWRAISIAALAAFAVAVALGTLLVRRALPEAPQWVGVVATPLLLLGSPQLALDVGLAYAVVWALAGWTAAGLAAMGPRPRPWLVGLALMLATLARLETIVVIGVLVLALGVRLARRTSWRAPEGWDGRSLAIAVGVAACALPVMLVHDWLLTGDPLFWARVSAAFSAATTTLPGPRDVAASLAALATSRPLASLAAAVGLAALWRNGSRPVAVGLLALGPGLGLLLVVLAARGTYVSTRYYAGIELAIIVAAAIGTAAIGGLVLGRIDGRLRRAARGPAPLRAPAGIAAVAVVVVATALLAPFAPLNRAVSTTLSGDRILSRTGDRSLTPVARMLAGRGLAAGQPKPADAAVALYVPVSLRPRMAVDLNLPLWAVGGVGPAVVAADGSGLSSLLVIVHSRRFDSPVGGYPILETGADALLGGHRLVIVATLPGPAWVIQVR